MTKENTYPEDDKNEERPYGARPIEDPIVHYESVETKNSPVLCGSKEYPLKNTKDKDYVTCTKCLKILNSRETEDDNKEPVKYEDEVQQKSNYKQDQINRQKIIISYLETRIEKLERCLHEHIKYE